MPTPPPKYPLHLAPQEPDVHERIEIRLTRMESRMVRMMDHLGFLADGTPKEPRSPEPAIRAHRVHPADFPTRNHKDWNDK